MLRDNGPRGTIGYGVPALESGEQRGSGNESAIARFIQKSPLNKFLGTAAASLISMSVAGAVVRHGSMEAIFKLQKAALSSPNLAGKVDKGIKSFRRVESYLDELQGVTRIYDKEDPTKLFVRDAKTRKLTRTDAISHNDGFEQRLDNPDLPEWAARDEIQQRMVAQARRLPYELPGFYAADKLILDPMLGNDQNKRKVNWSNPIDVLGDFADESIKNIALNVLPFDAAMGAGVSKYRKLAMQVAQNPASHPGIASTKFMLEQVGASASDLFNRSLKLSSQSIGAFSTLVDSSIEEGKTLNQLYRSMSTGSILGHQPVANARSARRTFENFRVASKDKDLRRQMLDSLPGPFKGIGSGYQKAKKEFGNIGKAFDDWQDVTSGRVAINKIRNNADPDRYKNLVAFMERGGGSYMERFAKDATAMNKFPPLKNGRVNPAFRGSDYYISRSNHEYQALFVDSLAQKTGLTHEEALRFSRKSAKIDILGRSGDELLAGSNIGERIQFGSQTYQGTKDDWWDNLVRSANAHKIPLGRKNEQGLVTSKSAFEDSVALADMKFSNSYFKEDLDKKIVSEWDHITEKILPQQAEKTISWIKRPFEDFAGSRLKDQKEYLVRQTAQRMGLQIASNSGIPLPLAQLEKSLRDHAVEPTNLNALRGFLIKKKDIAAPWSVDGRNLFGFKPLSIQDGLSRGYFDARNADEKETINRFVKHKAETAVDAASDLTNSASWRMRVGGAFTDSAGNVVDLGRVRRGATKFVDTLTNETQIPILKFNPLQILFRKSKMAQRNAPLIQMYSPQSLQPFLHGRATEGAKDDFMLWVRDHATKPVGRVFGVGSDAAKGVTSHRYEGLYHQFMTNDNTMMGHSVRVMARDMGIPSSNSNLESLFDPPKGETPRQARRRVKKGELRDRFDVAYDQENSVFIGQQSYLRRWRLAHDKTKLDRLKNPHILAGEIAARRMPPGSIGPEASEGLDALAMQLSNAGHSPAAIKGIAGSPKFSHMFDPNSPHGTFDPFNIHDVSLPQEARGLLDADQIKFRAITDPKERRAAQKAQQPLARLLKQFSTQEGFGDLPATGAKTIGVNRRIDQLRNEVADYVLSTYPIKSGNATDITGNLFAQIQKLRFEGKISPRQATESNAAILGLHLSGLRNKAFAETAEGMSDFGYGFGNLDINKRMAQMLDESMDAHPEIGQTLKDVANEKLSGKNIIGRQAGRLLRDVPYHKPFDTNPFGSPYALVPTFGSVREREGLWGALKGAGSWSNPETQSGVTAKATHMATRLNRYVETFGLGLDPTRYRGPADMYARGLIGRRVLPAVVAGSTVMAVDRTIGGAVHHDDQGNPIYSPFFLGLGADAIAQGQIAASGLVPGGQTASEKSEELKSGEVPIRKGRYWALSNQPWKGGRIQYFRPSWYQRFKAGASFTPEMHETPMEKLMFGQDFSPLRPLDPYRREREDALTRPYPVSGDYFTGPWGALNPILNATVGKVLKPRRMPHPEATQQMLSQYQAVGQGGAYFGGTASTATGGFGSVASVNQGFMAGGGSSSSAFYPAMGYTAPRGRASREVRGRATEMAQMYSDRAQYPGTYVRNSEVLAPYGVPVSPGYMPPRIIAAGQPLTGLNPARELGYKTQETLGIYGFAAANLRSSLGLGSQDLAPTRAMLEPSSRGYSSARAFWNLNMGGMGDMPIMGQSKYSNFEVSEIIRRFVPKDPQGVTYINDLPNLMGQQNPWLPGNEYGLNSIATGDPYSFTDAELRLPGTGYARTHQLFPDQSGDIGLANIHDILADTAPWSQKYMDVDAMIDGQNLSPLARAKVSQTRAQVEAMRIKSEFTPYEKQNEPWMETVRNPTSSIVGRVGEWAEHRDTFFNQKFLPVRTAVEDWEREDVYGATFPSWSSPYQSFIQAHLNKSTQRDPISATLAGGAIGAMFGATSRATALGAVVGGAAGGVASIFGKGYEAITGKRYLPEERRKQIALENYTDILKYTHATVNAERAKQTGDFDSASAFSAEAQSTMFGVDLNSTPEQLAMAVPERKRDHFRAMLYAPENEHKRILSTAGRLERRLFEAAWGMQVEKRPELENYFEERELPSADSSFWDPTVDMEHVKIKMGQSMGLDMAQMGYYPQQIQEANLVNPSYPDIYQQSSHHRTASRIRQLLRMQGVNGDVMAIPNVFGQDRVELMAGMNNG